MKALLNKILLIVVFASFISVGVPSGSSFAQQKDDKKGTDQNKPGEKQLKPTKHSRRHHRIHRRRHHRRVHHRKSHRKHHKTSKSKTDNKNNKKDNKDNGKK